MERGEHREALSACEKALHSDPDNAVALYLAGSIHAQGAAYDVARRHLERSIAAGNASADAHLHLGNVYRLTDDWVRAEESYRRALDADPAGCHAHYSLAVALKRRGASAEALEHLEQAQTDGALRAEVVRMRVTTLIELARHEEALGVARAAAATDPLSADHAVSLGFAYQKLHDPHAALECYEQAFALGTANADLFNNYAIVLQDLGRFDEAFASYDKALALAPDHRLARFHRSLARLLTGSYETAWADYEARLASREFTPRAAAHARWDGRDPRDLTLLVYREQGLGDEIMFASCLPELIARARHCVIECSPKLEGLFRRSFPSATVFAPGDPAKPSAIATAAIDAEVPMGSLPLYLRGSRADFPLHGGYLTPDPARVERWRSWLATLGPGLKIGLSWKGGTYKTRTPIRSIALERLTPLLTLPGVQFVSLQYTRDAAAELAALEARTGLMVAHSEEAVADYDETAALVSVLDLTVTVCTAVVHLAGALGRPVWVAAPHVPEWRYGSSGEQMVWYPSARVFRQRAYGDWEEVIERVAEALGERADGTRATC